MTLREEPARWKEDLSPALAPPVPRRTRRSKTASPFDDQQAFEDFVNRQCNKIEPVLQRNLDHEVQLEIGHFTRMLSGMPRGFIYSQRVFFEKAFDLLASEHPNLLLVAQIRNSLQVAATESSGFLRFVAKLCGRTPIQTVLFGLLSALTLLFLSVVLLDQLHTVVHSFATPIQDAHPIAQIVKQLPTAHIIVLAMAAFIGAIVSVLARLHCFLNAAETRPLLVYVTVATKPFVSIAFALFIYALMASGIVTIPAVNLGADGSDNIFWVIGFLSGFSERFVRDFVDEADRIAPFSSAKSAPSQPRKSSTS